MRVQQDKGLGNKISFEKMKWHFKELVTLQNSAFLDIFITKLSVVTEFIMNMNATILLPVGTFTHGFWGHPSELLHHYFQINQKRLYLCTVTK